MRTLSKGNVLVVAAAIVLGTGVLLRLDDARGENAAPGATGADVRAKAQARVRAAQKVLGVLEQVIQRGAGPITPSFVERYAAATRRLAEARLDAAEDSAARVRAAEQYVEQCRALLARLQQRAGQDVTAIDLAQGEYVVADAEYLLARIKEKP